MTTPKYVRAIAADIAREFRAEPHHWTQGKSAANRNGSWVPVESAFATCWCLRGAIDLRAQQMNLAAFPIYEAFDRALGFKAVHDDLKFVIWNDNRARTVHEVIMLCDLVAKG